MLHRDLQICYLRDAILALERQLPHTLWLLRHGNEQGLTHARAEFAWFQTRISALEDQIQELRSARVALYPESVNSGGDTVNATGDAIQMEVDEATLPPFLPVTTSRARPTHGVPSFLNEELRTDALSAARRSYQRPRLRSSSPEPRETGQSFASDPVSPPSGESPIEFGARKIGFDADTSEALDLDSDDAI